MGDMSDKKFQSEVIRRLGSIETLLSDVRQAVGGTSNGDPNQHVEPEYVNGVSKPDERSVVRLARFDNDEELVDLVERYKAKFGKSPLGPNFVVGPEELKAAWPNAQINDAASRDTNVAGTQLDGYSRLYRINGEVQDGVTRFRADENTDEKREPVFQDLIRRMREDLDAPVYNGPNQTGAAAQGETSDGQNQTDKPQ